jgi:protein-S-isoprenylcysteine O-methyltransferase Ste14
VVREPLTNGRSFRDLVFKNRGALLVPVALVLVIFGKPTATSAVTGIVVAALGEIVRIWAVGYSGTTTRADVVTAPQLVTAGPYAIVRNPLYAGNAIIALGFWLAFSGAVSYLAALVMLVFIALLIGGVYGAIVPLEEAYLASEFGEQYRRYRERVPRVVPSGRSMPRSERAGTWRGQVIVRAEVITLAFFALMVVAVIWKLRQ